MRIRATTTWDGEVMPSNVYDTEKAVVTPFIREVATVLASAPLKSVTITWDDGDTTVYEKA